MQQVKAALIGLVRLGLDAGRPEAVDALVTHEVAAEVADADLFYLKGNAKLYQHHYQDAIRLYEDAARLAPNWDAPHNNMGVCHERLNQKEMALACYRVANRLAPQSFRAAVNSAKIAFGLGQRQLAFDLLREFETTSGQGNADIVSKMAYVSYYLGEREQAERYARQALAENPACVAAIVQKVTAKVPVVYHDTDEVEEVIQSVNLALVERRRDCERARECGAEKLANEFLDLWGDPLFYLTYNGRLNRAAISAFNDSLALITRTAFGDYESQAEASRLARGAPARNASRWCRPSSFRTRSGRFRFPASIRTWIGASSRYSPFISGRRQTRSRAWRDNSRTTSCTACCPWTSCRRSRMQGRTW